MVELLKILHNISPMTDLEKDQIMPLITEKKISKHDYILKEGQICDFFIFIQKGSFRTYNINPNGDKVNIMLNAENDIIGNLESYVTNQSSNVSIQAIEPAQVIFIYKKHIDELYKNSIYWNQFGRKLTEKVFIESKLRLESLLYHSPEQRYLNLVQNDNYFLNRYPLIDIASFIGITPQSLSRIRSRI